MFIILECLLFLGGMKGGGGSTHDALHSIVDKFIFKPHQWLPCKLISSFVIFLILDWSVNYLRASFYNDEMDDGAPLESVLLVWMIADSSSCRFILFWWSLALSFWMEKVKASYLTSCCMEYLWIDVVDTLIIYGDVQSSIVIWYACLICWWAQGPFFSNWAPTIDVIERQKRKKHAKLMALLFV